MWQSPVDAEDSEEEEDADSNNEGGSLQSERTDKDEEACEGEPRPHFTDVSLHTANTLQSSSIKTICIVAEKILICGRALWRK